jgi:hypothetical protein
MQANLYCEPGLNRLFDEIEMDARGPGKIPLPDRHILSEDFLRALRTEITPESIRVPREMSRAWHFSHKHRIGPGQRLGQPGPEASAPVSRTGAIDEAMLACLRSRLS